MRSEEYLGFVHKSRSEAYDGLLAIVALTEEVGELAGVIKKSNIYKDWKSLEKKYGMTIAEKIEDEAGDVLYQFAVLLDLIGIDFETLMQKNYDKLVARHGGERTAEDGGKR